MTGMPGNKTGMSGIRNRVHRNHEGCMLDRDIRVIVHAHHGRQSGDQYENEWAASVSHSHGKYHSGRL